MQWGPRYAKDYVSNYCLGNEINMIFWDVSEALTKKAESDEEKLDIMEIHCILLCILNGVLKSNGVFF